MPKEILCAFSVHCDAVAGWLGSYIGEDSPGDISRGVFAGEVGMPRPARCSNASASSSPSSSPATPSRASRARPTWSPRPATRSACTATATRTRSRCRARRRRRSSTRCIGLIEKHWGRKPGRLCRALVGGVGHQHRDPGRARHHLRPQPDAPRLPRPTTCAPATPGRRSTTRKPAETWMKPFTQGTRDGPGRGAGLLVSRRPAADDVHQEIPEQPRLCLAARARGDLARSFRLRLPRDTTMPWCR